MVNTGAKKTNIAETVLPEAIREDQLKRWGIPPEFVQMRESSEGLAHIFPDGGFTIAAPHRERDGGLTGRNVLPDEEYLDAGQIQEAVEELVGYTYDQMKPLYRQGPKTPEGRRLRAVIDERFLQLAERGVNMTGLGRLIGWAMKKSATGGDQCQTMHNALKRARKARTH